jgi:hypothetical protein
MPQPLKKKPESAIEGLDASWEEDQKSRDYYYDDAHGYETFVPEAEDDVVTDVEESIAYDDIVKD